MADVIFRSMRPQNFKCEALVVPQYSQVTIGTVFIVAMISMCGGILFDRRGTTVDEHLQEISALFSGFSKVAAGNPRDSWFPTAYTPEELTTVTEENRAGAVLSVKITLFPVVYVSIAKPLVRLLHWITSHWHSFTLPSMLSARDGSVPVTWPGYPKRLNAIMNVDQAAALIVCSVRWARTHGIPQDKWIYLHGKFS